MIVAHIHEGAGRSSWTKLQTRRVLIEVTEVPDLQTGQKALNQARCLRARDAHIPATDRLLIVGKRTHADKSEALLPVQPLTYGNGVAQRCNLRTVVLR